MNIQLLRAARTHCLSSCPTICALGWRLQSHLEDKSGGCNQSCVEEAEYPIDYCLLELRPEVRSRRLMRLGTRTWERRESGEKSKKI